MTIDNKKVNEVANELKRLASTQRRNNNSLFDLHFEKMDTMLQAVIANGGFAAEVAKTVEKTSKYDGYKVAYISDKQAWVIAKALVEAEEAQKQEVVVEEVVEEEVVEEVSQAVKTTENDLQEGDKVAHSRFGEGVVVALTEDKITIDFEDEGEKTLIRKFVKLEKI